jgi:hypothetical protein
MSTSQAAERIWSPKDPSKTNLDKFRRHINQKRGLNLKNSVELHAWTTNSKTAQDWWIDLFEYEQLLPGHTPSCSIQSKVGMAQLMTAARTVDGLRSLQIGKSISDHLT